MSTGFATTRIPTNPSTAAMRLSTPTTVQHENALRTVGLGLFDLLVQAAPLAMILVERPSRVVFANPRAQAILDSNDGLSLAGGALCAPDSQDLERRLQPLLRGETGPAGELVKPFFLRRPSGRRPYEVTLRALDPGEGANTASRQVVIYVRDPGDGVPIDVETLRETHGLTPAEARTTRALVLGGTLHENSELLKLRPMTIRGYIKQVFAKTGTHSQLDLLRLIFTGSASISDDTPRR